MGWLRLVGLIKLYVSFAKEIYKRDDSLQKRPMILSILLTVATPYNTLVYCVVVCCSVLRGDTATHSNTLQHTATHTNDARYASVACYQICINLVLGVCWSDINLCSKKRQHDYSADFWDIFGSKLNFQQTVEPFIYTTRCNNTLQQLATHCNTPLKSQHWLAM